jgi:hypothetical protein
MGKGREGGQGAKSYYREKAWPSKKSYKTLYEKLSISRTSILPAPCFHKCQGKCCKQLLKWIKRILVDFYLKTPRLQYFSKKKKIIQAILYIKLFCQENLHPIQQKFLLPLCKPYAHLKLTAFRIRIVNPDPDPGRPKLTSKKGRNEKNFMFDELLVGLKYSPAAKFIVPKLGG